MQRIQRVAGTPSIDVEVSIGIPFGPNSRPADELTKESATGMGVNFADRRETTEIVAEFAPSGDARYVARRCAEVY